jgi:hypothetical protein
MISHYLAAAFRADMADLTGVAEERVEVRRVIESGGGLVPARNTNTSGDTADKVVIEALLHFPATAPLVAVQAWDAGLQGAYFPRLDDSGLLVVHIASGVDTAGGDGGSEGVVTTRRSALTVVLESDFLKHIFSAHVMKWTSQICRLPYFVFR